ncbi:unnamed protein product [Citrullus colocynthis]|uniref:Uncharacterized protein n=1 Tax=Citrullus colocynthis TaxID=252529 RepID=A0ABP0Z9V2_9ROSI
MVQAVRIFRVQSQTIAPVQTKGKEERKKKKSNYESAEQKSSETKTDLNKIQSRGSVKTKDRSPSQLSFFGIRNNNSLTIASIFCFLCINRQKEQNKSKA